MKREVEVTGRHFHREGYITLVIHNHPLVGVTGRGGTNHLEHRIVFFDHHGKGPFKCHWCRTKVTWLNMHVDHVNNIRHDNRISNLVSSCAPCNMGRGRKRAKQMRAKQQQRRRIAA